MPTTLLKQLLPDSLITFNAAEPWVLSQSTLFDTVGHAFLLEAVSPLSPQFSTSPASPSCEYACTFSTSFAL